MLLALALLAMMPLVHADCALPGTSCRLDLADATGYRQLPAGEDGTALPAATFLPVHGRRLSAGLTTDTLWVRFDLPPGLAHRDDMVLAVPVPILDHVRVFLLGEGGRTRLHSGDRVPFADRPEQHRLHLFPLEGSNAGPPHTLLIAVSGDTPLRLRAVIRDRLGFERAEARRLLVLGAFYGLMLALFTYNLALFAMLRDTSQGFYLGYMACATLVAAIVDGLTSWPLALPGWPNVSNEVAVGLGLLLLYFGLRFVRAYLHERGAAADDPTTLRRLARAVLALALVSPWLGGRVAQMLLLAAIAVTLLAIAVSIVQRALAGQRQARVLSITFLGLAVPTAGWAVATLGADGVQASPEALLHAGFALEALLLSIALADRINQARYRQLQAETALTAEREAFTRELIAAQEHERRSIAGDLHDGIGQSVLALKTRLDHWARGAETPSTADLRAASDVAATVAGSARDIAHRLHPSILERLGLRRALRALGQVISDAGIEVVADLDALPEDLPPATALATYRIVQEATTNVLRHAGAGRMRMIASRQGDTLQLQCSDDGRGLAAMTMEGFGLRSMRERAHMVGARLTIETPPGGGLSVNLHIPLRAGADAGGPANGEADESPDRR